MLEGKQPRVVSALGTSCAAAHDTGWSVNLVAFPTPSGEATIDDLLALNLADEKDGRT
jgi:hypothetical protein